MSFVGGNADESLYAVLRFLGTAPASWQLPIVWYCNGYAMTDAVRLLKGVVDAYVPDFKFGSQDCVSRLASAPEYWLIAQQTIKTVLDKDTPIIIRYPILPGNERCCYSLSADLLKEFYKGHIKILNYTRLIV